MKKCGDKFTFYKKWGGHVPRVIYAPELVRDMLNLQAKVDFSFLTLPQSGAKAFHYMFRELVLLYIYFSFNLSILLDINITD